MNDTRAWIVVLALVSFLAGGVGGFVLGARGAESTADGGPFAQSEERLARAFDLEGQRRELLRAVLAHYEADLEAVSERHEARTASAREPELRALGIRYRNLIRDRVLPENKRPLFDAMVEENTRILTEAH